MLVVLFKGKLLSRDEGIANWYYSSHGETFNDSITSYNGNGSLLIFLPSTATGSSPKAACKQIIVQENYTQSCIGSLEREAPWFYLRRREVIAKAKKWPNANKKYAPITGFLNMVLDADKYPLGPKHRRDPLTDIQLEMIRDSGLLEHASLRVRVGILDSKHWGDVFNDATKRMAEDAVERFTCSAKHPVTIEYWKPPNNPDKHECETINLLRNWCFLPQHRNSFVFYLNNKRKVSVDQYNYVTLQQRRDYMMYFLFEKWELCANTLSQGIPTCGINLRMDKTGVWPHYGGNYWWARCDWITKINHVCEDPRFWLLQEHYGKVGSEERAIGRSLWDDNVDNYRIPFPRSTYSCVDLIKAEN